MKSFIILSVVTFSGLSAFASSFDKELPYFMEAINLTHPETAVVALAGPQEPFGVLNNALVIIDEAFPDRLVVRARSLFLKTNGQTEYCVASFGRRKSMGPSEAYVTVGPCVKSDISVHGTVDIDKGTLN
jgi:hypothetical protein